MTTDLAIAPQQVVALNKNYQKEKPFQVYSLGTPNGIKVAIMLEELREFGVSHADYDPVSH